mgnify:CR=1 FL=1
MAKSQRKRLLIVKGSFEHFGGGERDLINNLSAWSKFFDISVATLHPNEELIEKLNDHNFTLATDPNGFGWKSEINKLIDNLVLGKQ